MFWQSAKEISQQITAEEFEQLPQTVAAVVQAAAEWNFPIAPRLSLFKQLCIIDSPRILYTGLSTDSDLINRVRNVR